MSASCSQTIRERYTRGRVRRYPLEAAPPVTVMVVMTARVPVTAMKTVKINGLGGAGDDCSSDADSDGKNALSKNSFTSNPVIAAIQLGNGGYCGGAGMSQVKGGRIRRCV